MQDSYLNVKLRKKRADKKAPGRAPLRGGAVQIRIQTDTTSTTGCVCNFRYTRESARVKIRKNTRVETGTRTINPKPINGKTERTASTKIHAKRRKKLQKYPLETDFLHAHQKKKPFRVFSFGAHARGRIWDIPSEK